MRKKKDINVFIVGGGGIGKELARHLSMDGCKVTVIDKDLNVVNELGNSMDVICFQGNGAAYAILSELDAGNADIFIAVSDSDELNILSCLTAHMLGAKHTVARVRNVDYANQTSFYRDRLGLSMTLNPEMAAASEINRLLRFPSATRVEVFAKGRAELIEMIIQEDNTIIGKSLIEIRQNMGINLLICAVVRDDEIVIPNGNFVIHEGDVLYLTGAASEFNRAFKKMKVPFKPLDCVLIAGGGRLAYYLAKALEREGAGVTVVEKNHEVALHMAGNLSGVSVIYDDALNYFDSMSESDIRHTDAFVLLTENDEFNLVASMYGVTRNIPKVITRLNGNTQYKLKALLNDGRICSVSKEEAGINSILGYVRSLMDAEGKENIESLYRLMDGKIEVIEFKVNANHEHLEVPLKDLKLKPGTLIACIIRGTKTIIPGGDDVLKEKDSVLVVTIDNQVVRLKDIYKG
ncbi:MAG: Trk system potassium transporter TrkA [Clostridiales bacterium]|nr:Trk system potassium transporter TrkA [Clostridiales bacterium]